MICHVKILYYFQKLNNTYSNKHFPYQVQKGVQQIFIFKIVSLLGIIAISNIQILSKKTKTIFISFYNERHSHSFIFTTFVQNINLLVTY